MFNLLSWGWAFSWGAPTKSLQKNSKHSIKNIYIFLTQFIYFINAYFIVNNSPVHMFQLNKNQPGLLSHLNLSSTSVCSSASTQHPINNRCIEPHVFFFHFKKISVATFISAWLLTKIWDLTVNDMHVNVVSVSLQLLINVSHFIRL